ncbi:putative 54S ribosomal protein L25, mitochondrial [Amylocarpus encephaloides]|uniref:54S ribosomal protein L25, mitochondrial n=1 Tax=Amylocarpus encephaloides TaxID=45428 RepID=A0A9P8C7N5_9HELO|nr:putative 54S ribosomal protein L25, mitochondrial [Amylocarpus encephaloides]
MSGIKPTQYVNLAQSLPPRLTRFFARYPPQSILTPSATESTGIAIKYPGWAAAHPSPQNPVVPKIEGQVSDTETLGFPNPFRPQKHPLSGNWHDPKYSLRRQADLCKLARKYGVEELLPPTVKNSHERLRKRVENGLRVKGTGIGQRVKGKESERTMKGRLEKRRKAMLEMPQMIQTWKERGHGRGWKKWPKS